METKEEYQFGKPYTEKIPKEDAEKYANMFGEGSEALTEVIKYCILNDITTYASCKGHPEDKNPLERLVETGYVTFRFDSSYEDSDFAYYIATTPLARKGLTAHLESNYISDRTVTLRFPARKRKESDVYLKYILLALKQYKKIKDENIPIKVNQEVKKIVDYMFYSWQEYEAFDITFDGYRKYERKNLYLKKVAKCPSLHSTGLIHRKFGKAFGYTKDVEEFVNSSAKKR